MLDRKEPRCHGRFCKVRDDCLRHLYLNIRIPTTPVEDYSATQPTVRDVDDCPQGLEDEEL